MSDRLTRVVDGDVIWYRPRKTLEELAEELANKLAQYEEIGTVEEFRALKSCTDES
jgi:hypothetical protein